MNRFDLFDFITRDNCKMIVEAIKNESDFEYEQKRCRIKFTLHSGRASCDWADSKTKKGDYIVLYGIDILTGDYRGYGGPLDKEDLTKHFNNVDNALRWIDNFLKNRDIKGYESLDETAEQLTLF